MAKIKIVPDGLHAVMAVDPGRTTGVVCGVVKLKPTLKRTLRQIDYRYSAEVTGNYIEQAQKLAEVWGHFTLKCIHLGIPVPQRHVAVEDFNIRFVQKTHVLDSIWVSAAFHGRIGLHVPLTWYQPSSHKSLATNDRLQLWGLYETGSEHKRDAWRVFAAHVNKLIV